MKTRLVLALLILLGASPVMGSEEVELPKFSKTAVNPYLVLNGELFKYENPSIDHSSIDTLKNVTHVHLDDNYMDTRFVQLRVKSADVKPEHMLFFQNPAEFLELFEKGCFESLKVVISDFEMRDPAYTGSKEKFQGRDIDGAFMGEYLRKFAPPLTTILRSGSDFTEEEILKYGGWFTKIIAKNDNAKLGSYLKELESSKEEMDTDESDNAQSLLKPFAGLPIKEDPVDVDTSETLPSPSKRKQSQEPEGRFTGTDVDLLSPRKKGTAEAPITKKESKKGVLTKQTTTNTTVIESTSTGGDYY